MKSSLKKSKLRFVISVIFLITLSTDIFAQNADIEKYLKKAEEYYKQKDYEATMEILVDALKKDPLNKQILEKLGEVQRLLDEKRDLSEEQKKIQETGYLNQQAQAYYDKGELNKAIQLWSKILAIDPDNKEVAWNIQKTQTRLQLEGDASVQAAALEKRDYSEKIKNITEDMLRLIDEAKDKLDKEKEKRKQEELAALQHQTELEEERRIKARERRQAKEETFILDTFNKGKQLYGEGRYAEALKEWELILPLLSKDDELRQTIDSLSDLVRTKGVKLEALQLETVEREQALAIAKIPEKPLTTGEKKDKVMLREAGPEKPISSGKKASLWIYLLVAILVLVGVILLLWARKPLIQKVKVAPKGEIKKEFDPSQLGRFIKSDKKGANKINKDIFKQG